MIVDANCPFRSLQKCKETQDYISDNDRMKRRIQTLSRGLAEIAKSSGEEISSDKEVVQFIHQSVKDFFVKKGLSALDNSSKSTNLAVGIAHYQLSRTHTLLGNGGDR